MASQNQTKPNQTNSGYNPTPFCFVLQKQGALVAALLHCLEHGSLQAAAAYAEAAAASQQTSHAIQAQGGRGSGPPEPPHPPSRTFGTSDTGAGAAGKLASAVAAVLQAPMLHSASWKGSPCPPAPPLDYEQQLLPQYQQLLLQQPGLVTGMLTCIAAVPARSESLGGPVGLLASLVMSAPEAVVGAFVEGGGITPPTIER
jgi:hypothetical protein